MIIEKKSKKRDTSSLKGTITPKHAREVIFGLTKEITTTPDKMIISCGGDKVVVNISNKGPSGRSSRYDYMEILAARDCCVLLNGFSSSTYASYCSENDPWYYYASHHRTSGKDAKRMIASTKAHLGRIGMEMVPVDGGMLIRKADGTPDIEDYAAHSEEVMIKKLMGWSTNNRV